MGVRDTYQWQERAAIAQFDGGYSVERAERIADKCLVDCAKADAPESWQEANKRWRATIGATYGQANMRREHKRLKQQHGAASFNDLTIGQIMRDVRRIQEGPNFG